jgi:hypothetical protein
MAVIEVGKKFGKLEVVEKDGFCKAVCSCECGTTKDYTYHSLVYGGNTCCGCTHTGRAGVKKSNSQAIRLSKELHGEGTYGYSRFVYTHGKAKVELFCNKHQEYFSISATQHLSRTRKGGCQKCAVGRRADFHRSSLEDFVTKSKTAQESLGRSFDYSRVKYETARIKVEIGCNACGTWFWQTPHSHSIGKGCTNCKNIKLASDRKHTKEQFVDEARKVVGDRYCFDLVEYKNARTYVNVICNDCGETFKKKPMEILNGHGCRCHAVPCGYKSAEPGNLYVLTCEGMTKVGITNLNPHDRAKTVSKSFGKDFVVLTYFTMDGQECTDLETTLLQELRNEYESPSEKFDGYTETFYFVDRPKLICRIKEILNDSK